MKSTTAITVSEVVEALAEVGLQVDTGTWLLKEQEVGRQRHDTGARRKPS